MNVLSKLILFTVVCLISCSKSDNTVLNDHQDPISNEDDVTSDNEDDDNQDVSFTIYSDQDYPAIPETEIPIEDQRFVGGENASDANDGSQQAPWKTFDKALQELCASSTWYCLNLVSDISVDAPIDTKFYGNGPGSSSQFAYIRSSPSLSSPVVLTINARVEIDGQENWLWYGFNMSGNEGINIGEDRKTNHHTIRNIKGTMTGTGGDNHGFFQALNYNADYFGVFNCDFTGPGTVDNGVHGNTSVIIAFAIPHMRIENNRVTNAPRPIYFKHSNPSSKGTADIHVRYNYQPETSIGESCFFAGRAQGGIFEITDNIFGSTVEISNGGGSEQPEGHFIAHNTFLKDLKLQNGNDPVINATLENNIILGNLELLRYQSNTNTNTSDYELIAGKIYYQSQGYTVSEWQQNSVPGGQDMHSIAGLPTFVDNTMQPQSYKLDMGSLGIGKGRNGEDIGARVQKVGNK